MSAAVANYPAWHEHRGGPGRVRMSATAPAWVTVFLDLAPPSWERGVSVWAQITGSTLSALRGDHQEFATLLPPDGDAHLGVQRRGEGPTRLHLDLHVADPVAAAHEAERLGGEVRRRSEHGYVVLDSPGGLPFCFVPHHAATRTRPVRWPTGHRSLLDQVCLDVAAGAFDREVTFWVALTGWEPRTSSVSGDFVPLARPPEQPWRFLLQRTRDDRPTTTAHLDLATDDRRAEVERHVALGATVEATHDLWTVLRDPVGTAYCITDRDPGTGMLPPPPGP